MIEPSDKKIKLVGERQVDIDRNEWVAILILARIHGWRPAGTLPNHRWITEKSISILIPVDGYMRYVMKARYQLQKLANPHSQAWDCREYKFPFGQKVSSNDALQLSIALKKIRHVQKRHPSVRTVITDETMDRLIFLSEHGGFSIEDGNNSH
jgi:hypothetical protein